MFGHHLLWNRKKCNSFFTGCPWDSDESDGSVFTSAGI